MTLTDIIIQHKLNKEPEKIQEPIKIEGPEAAPEPETDKKVVKKVTKKIIKKKEEE